MSVSDGGEGWGVKRPGDRVFHFYDERGISLCKRVAFYNGPLSPDDGGAKLPEDYAECYKRLQKRRGG